ncbi:MAG: hypothetical protein Q8M03_07555 [Legionella sp.]|nr:hypothetical protein [Legionella sp.]
MKDAVGNLISLTIFESYLSKYLIENTHFFEPVYQKILSAIAVIANENKSNRAFDRTLYGVLSAVNDVYPHYSTIESITNNFNLLVATYFLKLFFDGKLLSKSTATQLEVKSLSTISAICKHTLFRHPHELAAYLKPIALFDERNRGVIPLQTTRKSTTKLGITTLENTPPELANYFVSPHDPAQFEYKPDPESNVGRWFTKHNLPIIAGTSGSASLFLTEILQITTLDPFEIQLLVIGLAAGMIAEGYHSYFEVMIILDRIGFKLQSTATLCEFYEQTLPKSILSTDSYIAFRDSPQGVALLDGITDNSSESTSRELPGLTIGM